MGTQRITMKTVACILLLATIAYSAEVTQLSEMMDEVVYRISWNTQYDSTPSNTASKGTFKITIKGVGGDTTGEKTLVTHPGYACGAASDPEKSDYSEEDAKWAPIPGKIQHFYLKAKDVG